MYNFEQIEIPKYEMRRAELHARSHKYQNLGVKNDLSN